MAISPAVGTSPDSGRVAELALDTIVPNPRQPRRRFPPAQIEALARSIRGQGILQPLVVRPSPVQAGQYQLVAGERRLRAMRQLGLATAPALVRQIDDEHLLEAALVENLQREPLNPIEEAEAYQALLGELGCSHEELAARLGKDRSTIANMTRLLALPPLLREDLEAGRLTAGHARALLAIPFPDHQIALRGVVLERELSVRETERLVNRNRNRNRNQAGPSGSAPEGTTGATDREDLQFTAVKEMLERRFSTRIRIRPDAGHAREDAGGRIEIEYYSMDDFNRLYDLLMR